jgi:hypothetical protein
MIDFEYTKKPSIVTIRAALKKGIAAGETFIQVIWGENQITIEKTQWGWIGSGWIGKHGGHDIAKELK